MLTSFKLSDNHQESLVDECTAVAILMFMASSICHTCRCADKKPSVYYEKFADVVFLTGLGFLFLTTMFITFNVID